MAEHKGTAADGRDESEADRLDRNYSELLQELRVAETGVQILFASFFLSVLGLRKYLRFGDGPPPIIVDDELEAPEPELLHAHRD